MNVYLICWNELIKVIVKMFDFCEILVLLSYFGWYYEIGGRFELRQ